MGQLGIRNNSWKLGIIKRFLWKLLMFSVAIFYAKRSQYLQTKMCLKCVDTLRPKWNDSSCKRYVTSIYFDTQSYAWKVGIVQNLCEYYQYFFCDLLGQNCAVTTNIHTTFHKCSTSANHQAFWHAIFALCTKMPAILIWALRSKHVKKNWQAFTEVVKD